MLNSHTLRLERYEELVSYRQQLMASNRTNAIDANPRIAHGAAIADSIPAMQTSE